MFSAPVWWLTGNPVLAMNVAALASCVLCGAGAWLLARRLGLGPSAAFLGGVIFAFAPPRFLRSPQLHLTMIQWVPFTLAFLHSYLDSGRRRDLRLAALFFSLQALSSGHGAVFAALAGGALIVLSRGARRAGGHGPPDEGSRTSPVRFCSSRRCSSCCRTSRSARDAAAAFARGRLDVGGLGGELPRLADPRPRVPSLPLH